MLKSYYSSIGAMPALLPPKSPNITKVGLMFSIYLVFDLIVLAMVPFIFTREKCCQRALSRPYQIEI